jgi:molybdenum cofactor cytidylyltransferase
MIAGIILAAGESKRMGQPKQLMQVGLHTMLQCVVTAASLSKLDRIYVVVGHRAEDVRISLGGYDVHLAHNPAYAEGLGSSVRAGLAALPAEAAAAMFLLADQPFVTVGLIDELLRHSTTENIVAAAVDGLRSNPTVFGRGWFPELLQTKGDEGGRRIIGAHPEALVLVETDADLRDVDTPQDLAALP